MCSACGWLCFPPWSRSLGLPLAPCSRRGFPHRIPRCGSKGLSALPPPSPPGLGVGPAPCTGTIPVLLSRLCPRVGPPGRRGTELTCSMSRAQLHPRAAAPRHRLGDPGLLSTAQLVAVVVHQLGGGIGPLCPLHMGTGTYWQEPRLLWHLMLALFEIKAAGSWKWGMADLWDVCRSRGSVPGAGGCARLFSCSWRCPLAGWAVDVPPCSRPPFGCCWGAAAVQHGGVFARCAHCFFPAGSDCRGSSLSQSDALWFTTAFCRPPHLHRGPPRPCWALARAGWTTWLQQALGKGG